jgi:hypothetical protein
MNATAARSGLNVAAERPRFWASFRQIPAVLQAYACFTLLVSVCGLVAIVVLTWSANGLTTPWTNTWSAVWYQMFLPTFSILLMAINPTQNRRRRLIVGSLCGLLVGALLIGINDMRNALSSDGRVTLAAQTADPALQYPPLRSVVYIVVPAFWILMLLSPQIWRWQSGKLDGRVPVTLVDLFYWLFVAAACTALSISLVGFARNRLAVGQTLAELLAKQKAASQASPSTSKAP